MLTNKTQSTMSLAWSNAKWAQAWHGKGTKAQYLAGSLKLAHKSVSIKRTILAGTALACVASLSLGLSLGYYLASVTI